MHSGALDEALAAGALIGVLAWAIRRPRGCPEAVAAVPAALLVVLIRAVSVSAAVTEARRLAPVVGFLACVLVLAKLCDGDGLFRYLGAWLSGSTAGKRPDGDTRDGKCRDGDTRDGETRDHDTLGDGTRGDDGQAPGDQGRRLLPRVFLVAAVTTAVLSLDATVVLLTPVVLIAAGTLRVRARPHAYACGHLANSASLLLPVSNLTNLLAFSVSGLSFGRFAVLMALPWLAAIGVEHVAIRRFFAADLRTPAASRGTRPGGGVRAGGHGGTHAAGGPGTGTRGAGGEGEVEHAPVLDDRGDAGADPRPARTADVPDTPVFSLVVVGVTLGGFVVASAAGANPAWAALGGALLLAVRALARRETTAAAIARSADVPFLLFVIALGIVVAAVADNGLEAALRPVLPPGSSLPALLAVAALAAALAAVVNNLPAVLVLLPLVAVQAGGVSAAGPVLAVLLGVNIGPNLTYTGSLATMLWRRVLRAAGTDAPLGEFTRLGAVTVIPALGLSVLCLWLVLRV